MAETKHINILILGETGVGKSTWINSFANYLAFSRLEDAQKNEFVTIIPSSFTITDDNYQPRTITTTPTTGPENDNNNEVLSPGQSATQCPRTYKFTYYDTSTIITLIDTPGIGDSRGPGQDKLNFQMIMDHLAYYTEVHGICILMKPNNARLTVLFEFCVKHLLTHLHRDALKNIIFCFTNARNTFYRPGNTLPALQALLDTYSNDFTLPLNKNTMYCLDNESFQFLVAVAQGVHFDEQHHEIYSKSWEMSSKETHRLLEYIMQLQPHQLQNTLSINDARRVVIGLTKPLADITSNIQQNIGLAETKMAEIKNSKVENHQEMIQKLYIPIVSCHMKWLDHPLQVCTSPTCCESICLDSGEKGLIYSCKKQVRVSGGLSEKLRRLMRPSNCSRCKCLKTKHNIIHYDIIEESRQELLPGLQEKLQAADDLKDFELVRRDFLKGLLDRIQHLQDEQTKIIQICSLFAHFLKMNAIAPYNDTMIKYLEQNIEKTKLDKQTPTNSIELENLEKMKLDYISEVQILEENMQRVSSDRKEIYSSDIPRLKEELINLPINGSKIKDTLIQQEKHVGLSFVNEQFVDVKKSKHDKKFNIKNRFEKQSSLQTMEKRIGRLFNKDVQVEDKRQTKLPPKPIPPPKMNNLSTANQIKAEHETPSDEFCARSSLKFPIFQTPQTPPKPIMGMASGGGVTGVNTRPRLNQARNSGQVWIPGSTGVQVNSTAGGKLGIPNNHQMQKQQQRNEHQEIRQQHKETAWKPEKPVTKITEQPLPEPKSTNRLSNGNSEKKIPVAPSPGPPPPPPPPPIPIALPDGVGETIVLQRSALMDDIRNNKLKLKKTTSGVPSDDGRAVSKNSLQKQNGQVDLNAALKRALLERYRANRDTVDDDEEWM